jgi:hypothetical protein
MHMASALKNNFIIARFDHGCLEASHRPPRSARVDFSQAFTYTVRHLKGIVPWAGDHIPKTGGIPMKQLLSALMMAIFLVSTTGVAFADEMKGDQKKEEKKAGKKAEKKEKKDKQ